MSKEDQKWFEEHINRRADKIISGKFHIYDFPFVITAAEDIIDELMQLLWKYNNISPSEITLKVEPRKIKQ